MSTFTSCKLMVTPFLLFGFSFFIAKHPIHLYHFRAMNFLKTVTIFLQKKGDCESNFANNTTQIVYRYT